MVEAVRAWRPELPAVREVYYAAFPHAYPMHAHDGWAVMLVDDGAVSYGLHRSTHIAAPGALTILPPDVPHDGRPAVDGRAYRKRVVYLDRDWLPETAVARAATRPTLADMRVVRSLRGVHAALAEPGDLLTAEHGMLSVRRFVLRHLGTPEREVDDAPLARQLRDLIDERHTESFTITEIAASLGVHPSHLIRVFSRSYGLAPHRYLLSRRIDHARRLLVGGVRPADAAALAGFHDQAHLTRHFRRVLGTTPAAFTPSRSR